MKNPARFRHSQTSIICERDSSSEIRERQQVFFCLFLFIFQKRVRPGAIGERCACRCLCAGRRNCQKWKCGDTIPIFFFIYDFIVIVKNRVMSPHFAPIPAGGRHKVLVAGPQIQGDKNLRVSSARRTSTKPRQKPNWGTCIPQGGMSPNFKSHRWQKTLKELAEKVS